MGGMGCASAGRALGPAVRAGTPDASGQVPRLPARVAAAASPPVVAGCVGRGRPGPAAMPGAHHPVRAPSADVRPPGGPPVTAAVIVDAAGAQMGGAARYLAELRGYLARTGRGDVRVIGAQQRVSPGWLVRRELGRGARGRWVALNNVGFVARGGQRWTLLRNALHFMTEAEEATLKATQP